MVADGDVSLSPSVNELLVTIPPVPRTQTYLVYFCTQNRSDCNREKSSAPFGTQLGRYFCVVFGNNTGESGDQQNHHRAAINKKEQ